MDIRETTEFKEFGFRVVTCPVCEGETLDNYYICPMCGWEYDGCRGNGDFSSLNGLTVGEYREKYLASKYNIKEKSINYNTTIMHTK